MSAAAYKGHKVKILATINESVAGSKTKTLNTGIQQFKKQIKQKLNQVQ